LGATAAGHDRRRSGGDWRGTRRAARTAAAGARSILRITRAAGNG
jgi:hypothetical protein